MIPLDRGVGSVQLASVDRRAVPGLGLMEGARQDDAESRPAVGSAGALQTPEIGERLEARFGAQDTRLTFEKDEPSGKLVVRLKDRTGRVIRQIPPDEILRLARAINQYLGLLIDRRS